MRAGAGAPARAARGRKPPRSAQAARHALTDQHLLDEQALLNEAWAAFNRAVAQTDRPSDPPPGDPPAPMCVDGAAVEALDGAGSPAGRSKLDRLVIQNWKAEAGFIPIGDVEVELEPGQSVTLWLNKADPKIVVRDREDEGAHASLVILCEDEPLLG